MDESISPPDLPHTGSIIYSVDLSPVIERLIRVDKWKRAEATEAARLYRNFLFLKAKYGNTLELPPSYEIDEFWHAHILHSEDYYTFCQQAFGKYLHHHPHHGKDNSLPHQQLVSMFENQTQKLYHQEFGDYIYAIRPISFKQKLKQLLNIQ